MIKLPQLLQDKANHFIYGLVIFAVLYYLYPVGVAFATVLSIAILKEMLDKTYNRSFPSLWDVIATMSGAIIAFVITLI
jgi:VanZ family protein